MRRILFGFLAAFLIFLAACNAEEPVNNQSTREKASVNVEGDSKKEPVEEIKDSEEKPTVDTEKDITEESKESQAEETSPLTIEKIQEIIDYHGLGEGDQLTNVSLESGEITATIDLAPNEQFPAKDKAVIRYSSLSDELLKHEGWSILTVTYANVGTISMNRNEKETNEFGDYFPTLVIEERLK
ncbi:hypothetical protein [Neobacillus niacini]|uniref:hypothetical protein n=1 Tax=Neobacillus niacini TaxID=86668 RepID=UPI0039839AC4